MRNNESLQTEQMQIVAKQAKMGVWEDYDIELEEELGLSESTLRHKSSLYSQTMNATRSVQLPNNQGPNN